MTTDELKTEAVAIARAMREAPAVPDALRKRFVALRAALFGRGVFNPILARFDTATVTRASSEEIAAQLDSLATSL